LIPSAPGAHGSLDSLRAFIGEVVVHNQDSVHGARHIEAKSQQQIEQKLHGLPAKKHGDRRKQDREQEAHNVN
jgi:hypothetical protein